MDHWFRLISKLYNINSKLHNTEMLIMVDRVYLLLHLAYFNMTKAYAAYLSPTRAYV